MFLGRLPLLLRRTAGSLVPVSRRDWIAHKLDGLKLFDHALWARGRLRHHGLLVLTYHRVIAPHEAGELDQGVISAEPESFAEQLSIVQSHFTVVSMSQVRAALLGARALPANAALITFDDGYADAYHSALPILRRAGAVATFFVPTAFPGGSCLFWWDRASVIMRRCRLPRIELSYPARIALSPRRDPAAAADAVCKLIKRTQGLDLERLWDDVERATGVVLGKEEERALARRTILSWSEVRALRDAGMDVQSHSHAHRVINTLDPEQVERDLLRSRALLAEALGDAPYAVAYPVGYRIGEAYRRAVAGAGFDLGFTNVSGHDPTSPPDRLDLPRVDVPFGQPKGSYKLLLLFGQRAHSSSCAMASSDCPAF